MSLFSKKRKDESFYTTEFDTELLSQNNENYVTPTQVPLTPEEVLSKSNFIEDNDFKPTDALEKLKNRVKNTEFSTEKTVNDIDKANFPEDKGTLVDKCKPYFLDDNGNNATVDTEPIYKLKSVVEILKSDSEETIKRLSEKYGIPFEEEKTISVSQDEPKFEVTEEPEEITEDSKTEPAFISDIDMPTVAFEPIAQKPVQNSTVTFTPIQSADSSPSYISVSTKTQNIDLTGELIKLDDNITETTETAPDLENNDFDEFTPKEEFTDQVSFKKLIRKFSIKKKNSFLIAVATTLITVLFFIARLPFMSGLILAETTVTMSVLTGLFALEVILNAKMFANVLKIFSKSASPDGTAALSSIATLIYAVFGIVNGEVVLNILILASIILLFRAIADFCKNSYLLSNLKQISNSSSKYKIKLINDSAVTFSMVKDSIEGDALIAAPQKAEHILDYMKYSTFGTFLDGKLPIITIISLIISVVLGITCTSYFDGYIHGFYAIASTLCLTSLPTLFLIDTLPLFDTSVRLNKMGAMIAGKAGAQEIEMANATVLSCNDIFPKGTVTLHQMQVLSENNLDDTLIRAASLTEYIGSTLAPIFKEIAKSGNISVLPDADTVKYEDRMGISGWVDNRLLFIGNRTLMEAHGIDVPSVEVDRKILRKGYFPVYVATSDKACALLMIQYSVNTQIASELRKLTGLGVTLLVNNTDPNLTEEMICDYLGLYSESVKVMSAAGCHMYKNAIVPVERDSSPAAFKSNPLALISIINCATRIRRSNTILTVLYIICSIIGVLLFAYSSLGGSGSLISDTSLLLYSIICTVISYLLYLLQKP